MSLELNLTNNCSFKKPDQQNCLESIAKSYAQFYYSLSKTQQFALFVFGTAIAAFMWGSGHLLGMLAITGLVTFPGVEFTALALLLVGFPIAPGLFILHASIIDHYYYDPFLCFS